MRTCLSSWQWGARSSLHKSYMPVSFKNPYYIVVVVVSIMDPPADASVEECGQKTPLLYHCRGGSDYLKVPRPYFLISQRLDQLNESSPASIPNREGLYR